MPSAIRAEPTGQGLDLHWNAAGPAWHMSGWWLRDNCRCAACRHPGNGQKLYEIVDLPEDLHVCSTAGNDPGFLHVEWSDGHVSDYSLDWLAAHDLAPETRAGRRSAIRLWDRGIAAQRPVGDWRAIAEDPVAERAWLEQFSQLGWGLLRHVPRVPGTVAEVGDRLGHVRVTNYGRLFDVRSVPNPNNLADTALGLGVHSDNPYRHPSPGVQLLHCLESEAPGGDTQLVDGFHAAEILRRENPSAFELLATLPLNFRYVNTTTELHARQTLISTDVDGQVHAVHFNNRSADWLDAPAETCHDWYAAYRCFARILKRPELEVVFRLEPGECVVMQNDRTLHGRTAFDPNLGLRHLQGCYIDRDAMESRRMVLRRAMPPSHQETRP